MIEVVERTLVTPLDNLKEVDITDLMALVGGPECICGSSTCSVDAHHDRWPFGWHLEGTEQDYRDLPTNQIMLARCKHEWLHEHTEPPEELPLLEVMEFRIEEWRLLSQMIKMLREIEKEREKLQRVIGNRPVEPAFYRDSISDLTRAKYLFRDLLHYIPGEHRTLLRDDGGPFTLRQLGTVAHVGALRPGHLDAIAAAKELASRHQTKRTDSAA